MTPEDIWRGKRDEDLLDAAGRLDQYYEEGQWAILSELARRGLRLPNGDEVVVPERPVPVQVPAQSLTGGDETWDPTPAVPVQPPFWPPGPVLRHVWRGEFPLSTTYWGFAQLGGGVIQLVLLGLVAAGLSGVAVVLSTLALVYSTIATVGIWRSARRYTGNRVWADLARLSTLAPFFYLLYLNLTGKT